MKKVTKVTQQVSHEARIHRSISRTKRFKPIYKIAFTTKNWTASWSSQ